MMLPFLGLGWSSSYGVVNKTELIFQPKNLHGYQYLQYFFKSGSRLWVESEEFVGCPEPVQDQKSLDNLSILRTEMMHF